MHSCRETKEQLTELLLDCRSDKALSAELNRCDECRAEFDALNATLRITTRLRDAAGPPEGYWNGYHARLREKLSHAKTQRRKEEPRSVLAPLRLCLRTTVRVPVPLVVAVILAFAVLFATRAARETTNPSPVIVHVPVEVPVVQEKTITRVVYRERRPPARSSNRSPKIESTFAQSQKPSTDDMPAGLVGFKPTDEVKLTVIKGGSANEK